MEDVGEQGPVHTDEVLYLQALCFVADESINLSTIVVISKHVRQIVGGVFAPFAENLLDISWNKVWLTQVKACLSLLRSEGRQHLVQVEVLSFLIHLFNSVRDLTWLQPSGVEVNWHIGFQVLLVFGKLISIYDLRLLIA